MKTLLTSIILFIFTVSFLFGEIDSSQVFMSAFFVIPEGAHELKNNSSVNMALVFENKSDEILRIRGLQIKGKEQLLEEPRPVLREGLVPCRISTILVQFFDDHDELVQTERVPLTCSGEINPGKSLLSLITVKLPKKAGVYQVSLGLIKVASVGEFGSRIEDINNLSLWADQKSLAILKAVPVR